MVLRSGGWRVIASVAVCLTAADAVSGAEALDPAFSPSAEARANDESFRTAENAFTTGSTAPRLVWGGPVPPEPIPGEAPVYVPSRSAYPSTPQPQPQFTSPASPQTAYEPSPAPASDVYAPDPWPGEAEALAEPEAPPSTPRRSSGLAPIDEDGMAERPLYQPRDALAPDGSSSSDLDARMGAQGELPPLDAPVSIDGDMSGYAAIPRENPWAGLTEVTPGALAPPAPALRAAPSSAPILEGRVGDRRPRTAALQPRVVRQASPGEAKPRRSIFDFGRGALEEETPSGYQTMPSSEAICRRKLQKLGVKFVDATSIQSSRSCGIDYPVKIHDIAPGVAMRPSATLNCEAALRVAQWMKDEVKPAARWKLLKRPTVLINASSYRCSRIAGSRSISEHASGNALDVRGFKFSDGSIMEIEKKGFFEFRQKAFQKSVRESACRHFGTVLGPGYNEDHADHLHLDVKQRGRKVCK